MRAFVILVCSVVFAAGVACAFYFVARTPASAGRAATNGSAIDAIAQLEARVVKDERDVEAWLALGQRHSDNRNFAGARKALIRAAELAPEDADILVEAAKAVALDHPQKRFDADAIALLESALRVEPAHERARWFLGVAHRQAGDAAKAALLWESLIGQVDAPTERALRAQIAAARRSADGASASTVNPGRHAIHVHVQMSKEATALAGNRPEAAVYLFARRPDAGGMPIAVEKHALSEVPFDATLDDDDSPMPTYRLSAIEDVDVVAKLSPTGDPFATPGTPQSELVRVHLADARPIDLTIAKPAALLKR